MIDEQLEGIRNYYKDCPLETVRNDVAWLCDRITVLQEQCANHAWWVKRGTELEVQVAQLRQDCDDDYEQGYKRASNDVREAALNYLKLSASLTSDAAGIVRYAEARNALISAVRQPNHPIEGAAQ